MRTSNASIVPIQRRLLSPNPSSMKVASYGLGRWWVSFLGVPSMCEGQPGPWISIVTTGGVGVVSYESWFFLFTSSSHRDSVLLNGPWVFNNVVLAAGPWIPLFDHVQRPSLRQLSGSDCQIYHSSYGRENPSIWLFDQATKLLSKGRFAKLAVDVDLSWPLVSSSDIAIQDDEIPSFLAVVRVWAHPHIMSSVW